MKEGGSEGSGLYCCAGGADGWGVEGGRRRKVKEHIKAHNIEKRGGKREGREESE